MKGCARDTDGDGNCPDHPRGCADALPAGHALDHLVATRVMGVAQVTVFWSDFSHNPRWEPFDPSCELQGALVQQGKIRLRDGYGLGDGKYDVNPPRYSTDVAAAWLVVEALRTKGYDFDSFTSHEGWSDAIFLKDGDEHLVRAETFPLAICRAALQAKGVQVA